MSASEPPILDLPVGTGRSGTRIESDSMGEIRVPAEHYWEAQTQRSLLHFAIRWRSYSAAALSCLPFR
jgi:fumarate hydratase class II